MQIVYQEMYFSDYGEVFIKKTKIMDIKRKRAMSPRQEAYQINLHQNIKSQTTNDETVHTWLENCCICLPTLLSSHLFDIEACVSGLGYFLYTSMSI